MMHIRDRNLYLRAAVISSVRAFFASHGFLEVETPYRIPINAPEEHIDPFSSLDWYLHTSPELCMKRLLSRGHNKIFQICHCWRKGERGKRHTPEFTMLEWYRSNIDYCQLMEDCEDLLRWVAIDFGKKDGFLYQNRWLEPCRKAERITVRNAFMRYSDIGVERAVNDGMFDEIMVTRIEPALPHERPVFLMDYPCEMAALARLKPDDSSVAERFELYLGGLELANGFSELVDPYEQRLRFELANRKRISFLDCVHAPLPEPFLRDLVNMPPSAGIALGLDRLIMLFADTNRIDDVIAFTPEEL